jgi:spermidine synthase
LATTTEKPLARPLTAPSEAAATEAAARTSGWALMSLVFIAGATVMTVEMCASRLLAPYFGTSLFIWGILIGLVMIYLTVGYALGGRLADRYPRASVLYGITGAAGFAVGLIPLVSGPILRWSLQGFAQYSVGIFLGSLIGVVLLFAVPLTLLGFVSPFAIRLRTLGVASTGGTAGGVSALSTLGSILGTFIPVFLLIPNIGTAATLYTASVALLAFSMLGLLSASRHRTALLMGPLLAVVLALALFAPHNFIKPPAHGVLLEERESAYNYIQVVQDGKDVSLILNDGHAVHSKYNPDKILTGGPWDYWLVAPYFSEGFKPSDMESMAMIGSAAGTAAREFTAAYGPLPVDSVEIDPEIVDVGNRYFALGELKNNTNHIEDGRTYLQTNGKNKQWTVIGIDAYRQPYIPFHLTTKEFFEEVKAHLAPNGAAMINAGRTPTDTRLVDALAQTMLLVFPNVYVIDVPTMYNSMVVGTNARSRLENFGENARAVESQESGVRSRESGIGLLRQVFEASLNEGNIREVKQMPGALVFTDDKAPVEEVIDQIILGVVNESAK